ncbi:MAG: DUF5686 family protein [Prevotella sp.]|nr:DUF5686 family protein [Prevotella sp.]
MTNEATLRLLVCIVLMMLSGSAPAKGAQPDSIVRLRLHYDIDRRNFLLWLIPNMYEVARGDRHTDMAAEDHLSTMTVLETLTTPSLMSETLYPGELLSPLHANNRRYYHYEQSPPTPDSMAYLRFRPRMGRHVQLVRGAALMDLRTGKIRKAFFKGEHDMFDFETDISDDNRQNGRFVSSTTTTRFSFLGNKIRSRIVADLEPADTTQSAAADTAQQRRKLDTLERLWSHLASSHSLTAGNASLRLWPIVNPAYLSYSQSSGISYRMKLSLRYAFGSRHRIELTPQAGYNFKLHQLFYNIPARYTFAPQRDGYVEAVVGNGNRIGNSNISQDMETLPEDTLAKLPDDFNTFKDMRVRLAVSYSPWPRLQFIAGATFHQRKALYAELMESRGYRKTYNSFAPNAELLLRPWGRHDYRPTLTINYERSIKDILRSDIDYERIEGNISWLTRFRALTTLRVGLGAGLYTQRRSRDFLDFAHFCANYLPGGWDDDWSGDFQLLDSRSYNESDHYVRANAAFESPLMAAAWIPWAGRYVASECLYLNTLLTGRVHPYTELGYGLTTRWFSLGAFASFEKTRFDSAGCKMTLELFRHW